MNDDITLILISYFPPLILILLLYFLVKTLIKLKSWTKDKQYNKDLIKLLLSLVVILFFIWQIAEFSGKLFGIIDPDWVDAPNWIEPTSSH